MAVRDTKRGTGIEPVTIRAAIERSTTELPARPVAPIPSLQFLRPSLNQDKADGNNHTLAIVARSAMHFINLSRSSKEAVADTSPTAIWRCAIRSAGPGLNQ